MANSTVNLAKSSKLVSPVVTELLSFGSTSLSASTWTTVTDGTTNLSVTITPSATTSKVLLTCTLNYHCAGTSGGSLLFFKIQRNGSDIKVGDAASSRVQAGFCSLGRTGSTLTGPGHNLTFMVLDNPASTSSQTYTVQVYPGGVTPNTITFYVNEGNTNTDASTNAVAYSQIAATEVLA